MSNAQIRSTDTLRPIFLTALASFSNFVAGSARRPCAIGVQQHLF